MNRQPSGGDALDVLLEAVALEHVVERDEDRDLEQQRQAGSQRVDLVLLVELHHRLLLSLLVVLVLLLDLLELRLQLLHRPHRADLLHRDRQDREPDDEHQRDDRRPPAEVEAVVEEDDDLLGDLGEDRCDWQAHRLAALRVPWSGGAEQGSLGQRIEPAVAEGVASQDPPSGQDHAAKRPELADRLLGVGRAGRVVAAAPAERGGDEPAVEADRQQRDRGREPGPGARFTCNASRPPVAPPGRVSRATLTRPRPPRRAARPARRSGPRFPPGRPGRQRRCGRRGRSRSRPEAARRGPRTPRASPA